MYNIGDKFTIEIEKIIDKDIDGNELDSPLYMMKGFNSLIFDDEGLSRLTNNTNNDTKPNENEWVSKIGNTILGAVQIMKSEKTNDLHVERVIGTKIVLLMSVPDKKSYDEIDNIDPELVFKYMSEQNCTRTYTEYCDIYRDRTLSIHLNHYNPGNDSGYLIPICYDTETCKYICTLIFNFDERAEYDIIVTPKYISDNDTFTINIVAMRAKFPGVEYSDTIEVINTTIKF